jgi:hypothetical protein
MKKTSGLRYRGITQTDSGFVARITFKYQVVTFKSTRTETESAIIYDYALYMLRGESAHFNNPPEDEWPSEKRRRELWDMVVDKLTKKRLLATDVTEKGLSHFLVIHDDDIQVA